MKAISIELGTGNIRNLTREEALFVKDVDNLAYDTLLVCCYTLLIECII